MPDPAPQPTYGMSILFPPSTAVTGRPFTINVILKVNDQSYAARPFAWRPTVRITSGDTAAILPANYTFVDSDCGAKSFTITLLTPGVRSVDIRTVSAGGYATDGFFVTVADEYLFDIRGTPNPTAGAAYDYTVFCIKNGSLVTDGSWLPSIAFSATGDDGAIFPPTYTFVPADRGVKILPVTFSVDNQMVELIVTDVNVIANKGSKLINELSEFFGDSSMAVVSQVPFNYTLSTKVNGAFQTTIYWLPSVSVRSSDPEAILPDTYQFNDTDSTSVGHAFTLRLDTVGVQTIDFVAENPHGIQVRKTVTATVTTSATKFVATVVRTVGRLTQIALSATNEDGDVDFTADTGVTVSSSSPAYVNGVAAPVILATTSTAGQLLFTVSSATANTISFIETSETPLGLTGTTVTIN